MQKNSNLWWQYAAVAVLVAAGVFLVKSYFSKSNQSVKLHESAKLREYVAAKLPDSRVGSVQTYLAAQNVDSQEPDDCKLQRERLLTVEFDLIMQDIKDRRVLFNPACQASDSRFATDSYAEMIYKNCKSPEIEDEQKKNACATALFFYRSALVMNATRNQDVSDMDAQTLSHHLFAMLGLGELKTTESLAKLQSITDRLIEVLPNSPGAYKAALIPRLIQEMNHSTPENTQNLAETLNKAMDLNPNDPQVQDINLMLLTRDGRDISLEKAETVAAENPTSSAAQLFLAKAYARKQNYSQASTLLSQLAQRYPNDGRIQEAYAQLRAKDYEKLGQFQIGLSDGDF